MKSRKWIILVSIALLSVCAAIALCQFQELRINVIELEIPDPPGSKEQQISIEIMNCFLLIFYGISSMKFQQAHLNP